VLTELFLIDRLVMVGGKVTIADLGPTGNPILDDALTRIADSKPRDAKHWVSKLSRTHIRDRVLERLIEKGMLRRDEHRILRIIPTDRYPAEDDSLEDDVRDTVRAAVLAGTTARPRTAVLIGILKACDLLDTIFSRDERKLHKERIERIASAEPMSLAVSKAVKDMQATTLAAITAASAAAVASSFSG
jgi:hypothetical protein